MLNSRYLYILSASTVVIGEISNVFGNAYEMPFGFRANALIIFGIALGVEFILTFYLNHEEEQEERRRPTPPLPVIVLITMVITSAAVICGLAGNYVPKALPESVRHSVLNNVAIVLLLGVVNFVAIALAALSAKSSRKKQDHHKEFRNLLRDRYTQRRNDVIDVANVLFTHPTLSAEEQEAAFAALRPRLAHPQPYQEYQIPIERIFRENSGNLLILGKQGAAKTTYLVELARVIVDYPIPEQGDRFPVIFNLESWARDRKLLSDWMIDELSSESYMIPHKIAKDWVDNDKILPLLDGLNETTWPHFNKCVERIKEFQRLHENTPLVVCCRSEGYFEPSNDQRLDLPEVEVQPLSDEQVRGFLRHGQGLESVLDALDADIDLKEVVTTPLILRSVAFAYQKVSPDEIPLPNGFPYNKTEWLQLLWDNYVDRMVRLERGKAELGWWRAGDVPIGSRKEQRELKRKLKREELRLPTKVKYTSDDARHYLEWLAAKMTIHNVEEFHLEDLQWDWLSKPPEREYQRIEYTGHMRWSWREPLTWLGVIVIVSLMIGIPIGLFVDANQKLGNGIAYGAGYGLAFGLAIGLLGFAFGQIGSGIRSLKHLPIVADDLRHPAAGINRSLKNGLIGGIAVGLAYIVGVSLAYGLGIFLVSGFAVAFSLEMGPDSPDIGPLIGLSVGLLLGIPSGFLAWDRLGGGAYTRFHTLKRLLVNDDTIPSNFIQFLDFAEDRVLLSRIGGGYSFVHDLLQKYFADEWKEKHIPERPPTGSIAPSEREVMMGQP